MVRNLLVTSPPVNVFQFGSGTLAMADLWIEMISQSLLYGT